MRTRLSRISTSNQAETLDNWDDSLFCWLLGIEIQLLDPAPARAARMDDWFTTRNVRTRGDWLLTIGTRGALHRTGTPKLTSGRIDVRARLYFQGHLVKQQSISVVPYELCRAAHVARRLWENTQRAQEWHTP